MESFKNILIIRTDRLGDVILTLPLISQLKNHFPQTKISMLLSQYIAPLVENHTGLQEILISDAKSEKLLLQEIKSKQFDCAIIVHPTFRLAYLVWRAGIPVRIGTGYRAYSILFNRRFYEHRRSGNLHELEFNLNLMKAIGIRPDLKVIRFGIQLSGNDLGYANDFFKLNQIHPNDIVIAIHPGTGGSSRNWRPERMAEVGRRLIQQYHAKVILTGGPDEHKLVRNVNQGMENLGIELVGDINLKQLAAVYKKVDFLIANSTGPLHLAAAMGTFVVSFFPNIPELSERRWGPYTEHKKVFTPHLESICSQCAQKKQIYCECMDTISVNEVFNWITKKWDHKIKNAYQNKPNPIISPISKVK